MCRLSLSKFVESISAACQAAPPVSVHGTIAHGVRWGKPLQYQADKHMMGRWRPARLPTLSWPVRWLFSLVALRPVHLISIVAVVFQHMTIAIL